MKRHILAVARASGVLAQADRLMLWRARLSAHRRNRDFLRAHPGFATPPEELAFDAYHHVDWSAYHESGLGHARAYAEVIASALPARSLKILEWGCGPARIIRHMRGCLADREVELFGTDYNPRTIAWCQRHLPEVTFALNGLMPPLPFAEGSFDAAYNFSVFTHLSEAAQLAWAGELRRVLKPGGVLVSSTHGDFYRNRLASGNDAQRYDAGELVVQDRYEEGKKWFLALHPPRYVREVLLAGFQQVDQVTPGAASNLRQDLWVARKVP